LVLVYETGKVDAQRLRRVLVESHLPKLYIPKPENIIGLEQIPHLGSGKLDILRLRQIAMERLGWKGTC
ncbi:MAG: hypothetical protein GX298_09600, partial [Planctomycetes bacterium]|nr:hypothetical protein [Planctomycetota bacterium]